jgi:hypothetical protein
MSSQEFTDTLYESETVGTAEEEEELSDVQEDDSIIYDEIDSSKTLDEEIANFMVMGTADEPSEEDEVCVGTDLLQFIGHEFSMVNATTSWMKWDVKRPLS